MTEYKRKGEDYFNIEAFKTRAEIVRLMRERWAPRPRTETIPLAEAAGRVTAETLTARFNQPVVRAALADGIAVRSADFLNGPPDTDQWQEGRDYAPADMGDDFDDAFDMVINIEKVSFDPDGRLRLEPEEEARSGLRVKPGGGTLREGETLVAAGTRLSPYLVGLLAAGGLTEVPALARPRVAYLPTGDELTPPGTVPVRGQTIQSNGLMIAATLAAWGADCLPFPITLDNKDQLEAALDRALAEADLVLLNGGTSMGSEDHVAGMLTRRGDFCQHGVRSIPGMPMAVALINDKPVINVPGPPFAAFCGLDWCLAPLLAHWQGQAPPRRRTVRAILTKPLRKPGRFEFYARLHLFQDLDLRWQAEPVTFDERHAEASRRFNGLFIAPIGLENLDAGQEIEAEIIYSES